VSQWITGAEARRDGHCWRARACAVLTGIGTVMEDDPQLTVRDIPCERQPLRVLIDARLDVLPQARILRGDPILIATASADTARIAALSADGHELVFAVNYLSHFLLTRELLPLLEASAPEPDRDRCADRSCQRLLTSIRETQHLMEGPGRGGDFFQPHGLDRCISQAVHGPMVRPLCRIRLPKGEFPGLLFAIPGLREILSRIPMKNVVRMTS
jgi:hypothetical protein